MSSDQMFDEIPILSELGDQLTRAFAAEAAPEPRTSRTKRRRRFALAGAVAVAGLAVAGVLGFRTAANPQPALAATMDRLAHIAASQNWTGIPGPGQYLYTESEGLDGNDRIAGGKECQTQDVEHRRVWIANDGSGALEDIRDHSQFTSAADAATCAAMHITPSSMDSTARTRFGPGGLSEPTTSWHALSTDPATLLTQIHKLDGGPDTPAEEFGNVADFMRESSAPPAIRAALYKAAALIPGVELMGSQTDPAGQTGLGVAYDTQGTTQELIFDQQTARLLAEVDTDDSTGKPTYWAAYLQQKIVDSVPNFPSAGSPG